MVASPGQGLSLREIGYGPHRRPIFVTPRFIAAARRVQNIEAVGGKESAANRPEQGLRISILLPKSDGETG